MFGCAGSSLLRTGFLQLRRAGAPLCCGAWSLVVERSLSGLQARCLWYMGLDVPWRVESSWTRDQTHVPRVGRQILNHCTTREVPVVSFKDEGSHEPGNVDSRCTLKIIPG